MARPKVKPAQPPVRWSPGILLPMVRRPFCEVRFHHHFLHRLRLVGSVAPYFLYIYEYGVYMDKFTYISERIVGKERVDVIHFLRIMGAKHQIRQNLKK